MSPNIQTYESVTRRILEELERGTVPWHQPWLTGAPRNLGGRQYRGINILLLQIESMRQGWQDPRFGTFRAVKNAGGNVKKGQHGTRVILWKPIKKSETVDGVEEDRSFMLLRSYVVFNAEQCEGLPELERAADFEPSERAEQILEEMPNRPELLEGQQYGAAYAPSIDTVTLPARESFESTEAFYATAFHELTHSAGHENRVGGLEPADFGSDPYAREELIAELGASMLSAVAELEVRIESSAAYIENWKQVLEDDPRLVVNAAAAAQRRADYILGVTFEDSTEQEKEQRAAVVSS